MKNVPGAVRPRCGRPLVMTVSTLAALAALAPAASAQTELTTQRVAFGLARPVFVAAPPGDLNRIFIVEQRAGNQGRIRVMDLRTGVLQTTPYLSVTVSTGDEQGLLGIAFHPEFATNGYFWVNYTAANGTTVIQRFRAAGDPMTSTAAEPNGQIVLTVSQPFANHNAGWLAFGPDGYLYIPLGDGGNGGDPGNRAQNINELLGKILRIDVDGPDNIPGNDDDDGFPADPNRHYTIPPDNPFVGVAGADEIWAVGVRNPWRCDFDPATGDLYIADVGQDAREEINFQPAHIPGTLPGQPGYQGGRNYGWRCYEGNIAFNTTGCQPQSAYVSPILVYANSPQTPFPPTNFAGCSITGGIVYRGCGIPELHGTYFFADFCNNRIASFRTNGVTISEYTDRTAELAPGGGLSITGIAGFGRDGYGEMYICDLFGGEVFRLVGASPYYDLNGDNAPDTCVCPADWDGNGAVTSSDISAYLSSWLTAIENGTIAADYNRDGVTNSTDISAFLTSWLAALSGGC
jgi:glucose/arabinose dehydrogenase